MLAYRATIWQFYLILMKKHLLVLSLLFTFGFVLPAHSQGKIKSTKQLLKAMKKRYQGKWFSSFTFIQKTIRYKDGKAGKPSLWHEAIQYPNKFRIDFGDLKEGNSVVFAADSGYRFRQGKLVGKRYDPQYFLLMKGGLYHRKLKECLSILKKGGYQTNLFHKNTYKGRPVYVIGAKKGDLKTPQFWIDKEHFYVVRRMRANRRKANSILDVQYQNHKATGGGWVEQTVRFEVDGKLVQIEEYTKIDTSPRLPKSFFNPTQFGKAHWADEE